MQATRYFALTVVFLAGLGTNAQASSTTSSAVSDSATSSASSASDSVTGSSTSSKKVVTAQGDYTVVELAAAPNKPGMVQVALQAADSPDQQSDFTLLLPRKTIDDNGLAVGQTISAKPQNFGLELSGGMHARVFYLILHDALRNELRSVPVSL